MQTLRSPKSGSVTHPSAADFAQADSSLLEPQFPNLQNYDIDD